MGDRAYLILSLGWAPTQDKLDWADKIIKANPDKNVIVTTHAFMYWDGTHLNDEDLDYTSGYTQDGMDGSEIWEQLGKKNENVVLAIGRPHRLPRCHRPHRRKRSRRGSHLPAVRRPGHRPGLRPGYDDAPHFS